MKYCLNSSLIPLKPENWTYCCASEPENVNVTTKLLIGEGSCNYAKD